MFAFQLWDFLVIFLLLISVHCGRGICCEMWYHLAHLKQMYWCVSVKKSVIYKKASYTKKEHVLFNFSSSHLWIYLMRLVCE